MTIRMASIPTPTSKEFAEFRKNYEAQEAAKEQAKKDEIVRRAPGFKELQQELRIHNYELSEFWGQSLPAILKRMGRPKPDEAMKSWLPLFWNYDLVNTENPPALTQSGEQAQTIFNNFVTRVLPETQGLVLSSAGGTRLQCMCQVALRIGHVTLTNESLQRMVDVLIEHSCFGTDEVFTDKSRIVRAQAEPEPEVTLEDLNLSNPEHNRIAHRITQYEFDSQFRPVVLKFVDHMWSAYHYELTQVEADAIRGIMEKRNLPRTMESLLLCKRVLIQNGILPPSCYSHEELKSIAIEATPSDDKESLRVIMHGTLDALKALMARKGLAV